MKRMILETTATLAALTMLSPIICAQAHSADGKLMLRDGTTIRLKLMAPISSKTAHVGDPVPLELAQDLRVNDVLVVREGASAMGEVTTAKKAGMLGKGGDLAISLTYLKAGDYKVKLRGTKGKEGDSKVKTAIVLTAAFGIVGFMKHGKQAEIPAGTMLEVYAADDIALPPLTPVGAASAAPVSAAAQPAIAAATPISITSEPAGGEIEVDGRFLGSTPSVISLAPGEYKVKVTHAGRTWERTVVVTAGSKLALHATL